MKSNITKYECWSEESGITFTEAENAIKMRKQGLISKSAVLLYEIEAQTWDEAMAEHYKKQGWKPYLPINKSED